MALDNQYKEHAQVRRIKCHDYPKKGDWYWDRYRHRVVRADKDVGEKMLILRGEDI